MAFAKRSAAFKNGLDKKTDLPIHSSSSRWQPIARMRPWSLLRRKRFLLTLLGLCAVYLFIRYLPHDVPSVGLRIDPRTGRTQGYPLDRDRNSRLPGFGQYLASGNDQDLDQLYDGPVKFYHLAVTLRPHLRRYDTEVDNVVFLLRDLRVVSSFIPLACEMALYNRTAVHIAVMTLQDNSIKEIMAVNGIKQADCPVFWHDARPDYNIQSSFNRRANVIKAALGHMETALKPSVFIIDEEQAQDRHFKDAVRAKLDSIRMPLNVVPKDAMKSMAWIAGLSGPGLALLNHIRIDIVITPYKESAGSLWKLLQSIQNANYEGLTEPRITIDLPQNVGHFASHYLEYFQWPVDHETGQNKLILRRRVDESKISPAIASLRSLESFYPASWPLSHVLVLEPDVELSPDYLHYLTYLTLEYKYGKNGLNMTGAMMGISLDLPERGLHDESAFIESTAPQFNNLFWSQSPSSTAALYFGDKWIELQDWLTQRLRHDSMLEKKVASSSNIVSTKYPAWLAIAQELMHARNYYFLYPGFAKTPDLKLVTIHNELHQDPEEFAKDVKNKGSDRSKDMLAIYKNDVLKGEDGSMRTASHVVNAPPRSLPSLLLGKKKAQDRVLLPQDVDLEIYSSKGRIVDPVVSQLDADAFGDRASLELGGCNTLAERDERQRGSVEYFFCKGV